MLKSLFFILILSTAVFAVGGGGGGGGDGGGVLSSGVGGSSRCAGLCELECMESGAVRFLASGEQNLTASGPDGNFTVTGYWSFNRFVSDEVLFTKKGRYTINGYPVDCPGLKFSCILARISINICTKGEGYVEAEFTARNFDNLDSMKYEFLSGSRAFYYTSSLKSGQVLSFFLKNLTNNTYSINVSIREDADRLRISDSRCAAKTVIECTTQASKPSVQSRTFLCHDMETLRERVGCRLALTEEQRYTESRVNFLPEECRALVSVERDECINTYDNVQKCWKYPEGEARVNCVRGVIGFTNLEDEKRKCAETSDAAACIEKIKKNIFTLIKFRFYDLEERAEERYQKNPELVASLVAELETRKQEFNAAKTLSEKRQVVLAVRALWKSFARDING